MPERNIRSRRDFLGSSVGVGSIALASLFNPRAANSFGSQAPHFAPKAKRIIWLTQSGAPSQLDLFDYKPLLGRMFDEELPHSVRGEQRLTGMTSGQKRFPIAPSIFNFGQHGESGTWISELLPNNRLTDVHGEVIRQILH